MVGNDALRGVMNLLSLCGQGIITQEGLYMELATLYEDEGEEFLLAYEMLRFPTSDITH